MFIFILLQLKEIRHSEKLTELPDFSVISNSQVESTPNIIHVGIFGVKVF